MQSYEHNLYLSHFKHILALKVSEFNFLSSDDDADTDIPGFPDQKHIGLNHLVKNLQPLVGKGLRCVLIFGVVEDSVKDEKGSAADYGKSPVIGAIKLLRAQLPSLIIACDVCLCTYTHSHHCCESCAPITPFC